MSSRAARKLLASQGKGNTEKEGESASGGSDSDEVVVETKPKSNLFALLNEEEEEEVQEEAKEDEELAEMLEENCEIAQTKQTQKSQKKKKKKNKKKSVSSNSTASVPSPNPPLNPPPSHSSLDLTVDVRYLDPLFEQRKIFGHSTVRNAMKDIAQTEQARPHARGRRTAARKTVKKKYLLGGGDEIDVKNPGIHMEYRGVSPSDKRTRCFHIRWNREYTSSQEVGSLTILLEIVMLLTLLFFSAGVC